MLLVQCSGRQTQILVATSSNLELKARLNKHNLLAYSCSIVDRVLFISFTSFIYYIILYLFHLFYSFGVVINKFDIRVTWSSNTIQFYEKAGDKVLCKL